MGEFLYVQRCTTLMVIQPKNNFFTHQKYHTHMCTSLLIPSFPRPWQPFSYYLYGFSTMPAMASNFVSYFVFHTNRVTKYVVFCYQLLFTWNNVQKVYTVLQQGMLFRGVLWLNNIPLYHHNTFGLSTQLMHICIIPTFWK